MLEFPSDEQIQKAILEHNIKNPEIQLNPLRYTQYDKKIISENANRNNEKIFILRILIKPQSSPCPTFTYFAVNDKGEPIGWVKFNTSFFTYKTHKSEIMYHIFPKFMGQGFGTLLTEESIKDFMENKPFNNIATLNGQPLMVYAIEAVINPDNFGSLALVDKNGFRLESKEDLSHSYILTEEMYNSKNKHNEELTQ